MLNLTVVGYISKQPTLAQSQKGTQYLKFQVEVPAQEGRYPKRVGVTVFGQQAGRLANELQQTQLVSLTGEPQARGYQDKTGKAAAVLEMIAREVNLLGGPVVNAYAQDAGPVTTTTAAAAQSTINFDDIPF